MQYGEEAQNIEAMEASFQRIPAHLRNQVKPPDYLTFLLNLFSEELNTERGYFSTGLSQRIPVSKIKESLQDYNFKDYEIEELSSLIIQMDREYCAYDNTRIQQYRKRHSKNSD